MSIALCISKVSFWLVFCLEIYLILLNTENPLVTIEDILASRSKHDFFEVSEVIPVKFLTDLTKFNEELKEKQRVAYNSVAFHNSMMDLCCEHPCCAQLQQEILELKSALKKSDLKVASLYEELTEMRDLLTTQLSKFSNPRTDPRKPGDLLLEGKWPLRRVDVVKSAADSSKYDFATLVDKVFGIGYLTKFRSITKVPQSVMNACNTIIGKLYY